MIQGLVLIGTSTYIYILPWADTGSFDSANFCRFDFLLEVPTS